MRGLSKQCTKREREGGRSVMEWVTLAEKGNVLGSAAWGKREGREGERETQSERSKQSQRVELALNMADKD